MRRKFLSLILALLLLLVSALPAFAQDVTTFGFDQWMNRYNQDMTDAPSVWPAWHSDVGESFSQPLILDGSQFGLSGSTVVIAAAGGALYGWVCPAVNASAIIQALGLGKFAPNMYKWSVQLAGDTPTISHPTLVTINGRKIVFIGSAYDSSVGGAKLQAIDVTDGFTTGQVKPVLNDPDPNASDIVSAPMVTQWNGHWIAIYTTGNTGRVCIMTGLDQIGTSGFNQDNVHCAYLSLGGRTSSTPIGVMYQNGRPTGFAVGVDGGPSSGALYVFRFNDILSVDGNGNVVVASKKAWGSKTLQSGLVASFSASQDGNTIYFGDCDSRVYSWNVPNHVMNWVNTDVAGMFSNRSPALSPSNVYFSAGTNPNGNGGAVISIDRATGHANWTCNFQYPVQTAPTIWPSSVSGSYPAIVVGNSKGYIAMIDADDGSKKYTVKFTDNTGTTYATGITGEISLADGYMVAGTNNGILAWSEIAPVDMQAVSLDPGCPQVNGMYTAKPGQTYTATVTFNCLKAVQENAPTLLDYPDTPVGGFNVTGSGNNRTAWPAALSDSNGPLQTANINGLNEQVTDMSPVTGPYKVTFQWTAQPTTTAVAAAINVNYPDSSPQMVGYYPELDLTNNVVSVPINIYLPDNLSVRITDYPGEVTGGQPGQVVAQVTNTSGKYVMTDLVWKIDGQVVKSYDNFDLVSQATTTLDFTMPDHDITIEVDVNPNHDRPPDETNWDDNSATCTVKYKPPDALTNTGDIAIIAPDDVRFGAPWQFTVQVTTHIPEPPTPPNSPPPPPPVVHVSVSSPMGSKFVNGYTWEHGDWGAIINDPPNGFPVTPTWPDFTYTAQFGDYTYTKTFTFPKSGMVDRNVEVVLYADADCLNYDVPHMHASKKVVVDAWVPAKPSTHLTQ